MDVISPITSALILSAANVEKGSADGSFFKLI